MDMFRDASVSDIILNIILSVFFIAMLYSMYKLHRANSKYENFNLVWLLVNKHGYPDGAKCIEMGTWVLTSWGFIVYILNKTLPDWYLIAYIGAFIARGGVGAYLRSQSGEPRPVIQPPAIIEPTTKLPPEVKP